MKKQKQPITRRTLSDFPKEKPLFTAKDMCIGDQVYLTVPLTMPMGDGFNCVQIMVGEIGKYMGETERGSKIKFPQCTAFLSREEWTPLS